MKILGIDPGTTTIGYCLLQETNNNLKLLDFGTIDTPPNHSQGKKLTSIYAQFKKLVKKNQPDIVIIERLFFFMNAKTAMAVSQAKGVMILAATQLKKPIVLLAPLQIKLQICGNGRATKKEVKNTIQKTFQIKKNQFPKKYWDDVSDAIAIAFCYTKMKKAEKEKKRIKKTKPKIKKQRRGKCPN